MKKFDEIYPPSLAEALALYPLANNDFPYRSGLTQVEEDFPIKFVKMPDGKCVAISYGKLGTDVCDYENWVFNRVLLLIDIKIQLLYSGINTYVIAG